MPSITKAITTHEQSEVLSFHAMIENLSSLLYDCIYRGHKFSVLLHSMNHDVWVHALEKQASSQRSLLPLAFKGCSVALGVLHIGALACPTATLQKFVPQFLQAKAGAPEKITKLLGQMLKPGQDLSNFAATFFENHETAHRTELGLKSEIAHSAVEQATRRKMDLDGDYQKMLQMIQALYDANRSSLQAVRDKR